MRTDVSDSGVGRGARRSRCSTGYGACHLLFNNAGVTSGGGGLPWEQEPNDWKWCFGVNVFGVANGVLAFVPRMIESRRAGRDRQHVVGRRRHRAGAVRVGLRRRARPRSAASPSRSRTSSTDNDTNLRAAVFYPSGGLLDTGLWTAQRNRPPELAARARARARPGADVRAVPRTARGAGHERRPRRPRRARPVRRRRDQGRALRDRPRPRRRRPAAARACDAIGKGVLPPHHNL